MSDKTLVALLASVESVFAFSAFEPSVFTIRKLAKKENGIRDIREGYIPATMLAYIISGLTSAYMHSARPLIFTTVIVTFLILTYEWAIAGGE